MRWQCGPVWAMGLVWLAGCSAPVGASAPPQEIYLVRQSLTVDGLQVMPERSSFSAVTVTPGADGSQTVRQRTLWFGPAGAGSGSGSLALSPDDPQEQQVLAVIGSGFEMTVDAQGVARGVRAVDAPAFAALQARHPELADGMAPREQVAGLRPLRLPEGLAVGQEIVREEPSAQWGTLTSRLRVRALTDDVAVMDVGLEGMGVRGQGRQAVRRRDGMPVELRLELQTEARGGRPAATLRLNVTHLGDGPDLTQTSDADTYRQIRDDTLQALANPPFSAPSDDPGAYRPVRDKEGELADWMLPASALDKLEEQLLFAARPNANGHRPWLAIGGQFGVPPPGTTDDGVMPPMVVAHLRSVALLDAQGAALPGVAPVLTLRKLVAADRYRVNENEVMFPFRLPLQATAAQLRPLDAVRMAVDVEVYEWAEAERVAAGAQSQRNPDARIVWTAPQRLSIDQARPPATVREGLWTLAVPLDAQGREVPSASMLAPRYIDDPGARDPQAPLPLAREVGAMPLRIDIAAAQPIAAVQLRHYRWKQVPRTWTFQNARTLARPPAPEAAGRRP